MSIYPETYPREQWYMAAHAEEVGRELLARTILGLPMVLYRTQDGRAVALVDQCIHRQFPLSRSRLDGDDITCGYHGLVFDPTGACVHVPQQSHVPPRLRVRRFPVREQNGLLWVWPGDEQTATDSPLPSASWMDAPGWHTITGRLHMDARAQLLNENLLDLSHTEFLHDGTIGVKGLAEQPVQTVVEEGHITVSRQVRQTPASPLHRTVMGIDQQVDFTQVAECTLPGFHVTHTTTQPIDGDHRPHGQAFEQKVVHGITPETDRTTHYFWGLARNYRLGDDALDAQMTKAVTAIFADDIAACEAIERVLELYEPVDPDEVNIKVDAGPMAHRRQIQKLMSE